MECPFCDISKEKNEILKEGRFFYVILSNPSLMEGHTLIVPKRHLENVKELNGDEERELFGLIREFEEKILKNLSSGCDFKQNYRPFMKQGKLKVNHLHFHLQPRDLYDELYEKCQKFETEIFKELSKDELEKAAKKINF
jgi:diadenosine tetraphosphate (Ap4A) HIT family hydrolase